MQARPAAMRAFLLLACLAVSIDGATTQRNMIGKIISMLGDMQAKARKEMENEEIAMAKFSTWCKDTEEARTTDIATSKQDIEDAECQIADASSTIQSSRDSISEDESQVAARNAEMQERNEARAGQHKEFQKEKAELEDNVQALEAAIIFLKRGMREGATQLTQEAQAQLTAMLQSAGVSDDGTPDQYDSHAGGILEMVENLLDKARDELRDAIKGEMNAKHNHDMVSTDLDGQIKQLEGQIERSKQTLSDAEHKLGANNEKKADASAKLAEDQKYLSSTRMLCRQKAEAYPERREMREAEIEAIAKAVDILQKYASLIQVPKKALLQYQTENRNPNQSKALAYLISQAHALHSTDLSLLTQKIAEDPFGKVKKMIYEMINKLMNQANEEAEHKGWCDGEMGTNAQVRKDKTAEVNKLTGQRESLNAEIRRLSQDIAQLASDLTSSQKAMEEQTNMRREENQEFVNELRDLKESQQAVADATRVLADYYEKAGQATALMQAETSVESEETQDPAAEIAAQAPFSDDAFQGQQDSAGGIMGFLEVVASDMAKEQAELESSEAQSKNEFDDFMQESKRNVAVAQRQKDNKSKRRAEANAELKEAEADLNNSQKELDAANRYHQKLIPSCVHQPMSFEEKQAKRAKEIQSLKEALEILNSAVRD